MSETTAVRKGEELHAQKLAEFIAAGLPGHVGDIVIEQFPGGASNLTYLVRIGSDEYVLRRPPFGNTVKSAHDMSREFNVLSKLSPVYPPAPRPLIYCDNESVIGSEFYLMERRRGLILRRDMPEVSETQAQEICESFVGNLASLHSLDYEKIGLGDFGKPDGFARRQVEGWTKRYFNAKTDEWAELESAIEWLNSRIPAANEACLIHNDYKFDNVILNPDDLTQITGVLDWEMAAIGCPLMDFGTTLGYWADPSAPKSLFYAGFNPVRLMSTITRKELAEMYAKKSGRDLSNILYYYVFGLFKIAVIAQQIYARYAKGFTDNEKFAQFNLHAKILGEIAAKAIEKGKI
jgi:aminoglycoside phosphotransferase (APT) family kinase protein